MQVEGGGLRVESAGLRVESAGWRVEGEECRVEGGGWRTIGLGVDPTMEWEPELQLWRHARGTSRM